MRWRAVCVVGGGALKKKVWRHFEARAALLGRRSFLAADDDGICSARLKTTRTHALALFNHTSSFVHSLNPLPETVNSVRVLVVSFVGRARPSPCVRSLSPRASLEPGPRERRRDLRVRHPPITSNHGGELGQQNAGDGEKDPAAHGAFVLVCSLSVLLRLRKREDRAMRITRSNALSQYSIQRTGDGGAARRQGKVGRAPQAGAFLLPARRVAACGDGGRAAG